MPDGPVTETQTEPLPDPGADDYRVVPINGKQMEGWISAAIDAGINLRGIHDLLSMRVKRLINQQGGSARSAVFIRRLVDPPGYQVVANATDHLCDGLVRAAIGQLTDEALAARSASPSEPEPDPQESRR